MTPTLRLKNVACRRGGRLLFEGLDLELGAGDALQVIGPNGCGKSSLIRLAAGLLAPETGEVDALELALADDSLALDRELPLVDALRFWGGDDVDAGLRAMGLTELGPVPVRILSAGQAKRASIARVVASGAPLWLLDEPANALDSAALQRLAAAIANHRRAGGAVLAASHTPLPGKWRTLDLGK